MWEPMELLNLMDRKHIGETNQNCDNNPYVALNPVNEFKDIVLSHQTLPTNSGYCIKFEINAQLSSCQLHLVSNYNVKGA